MDYTIRPVLRAQRGAQWLGSGQRFKDFVSNSPSREFCLEYAHRESIQEVPLNGALQGRAVRRVVARMSHSFAAWVSVTKILRSSPPGCLVLRGATALKGPGKRRPYRVASAKVPVSHLLGFRRVVACVLGGTIDSRAPILLLRTHKGVGSLVHRKRTTACGRRPPRLLHDHTARQEPPNDRHHRPLSLAPHLRSGQS
jgi:hypothetical protein